MEEWQLVSQEVEHEWLKTVLIQKIVHHVTLTGFHSFVYNHLGFHSFVYNHLRFHSFAYNHLRNVHSLNLNLNANLQAS